MLPSRLFIIDAFAEKAFSGNPAAVCLLDEPADAALMQSVAAEMNLSETAFVVTANEPYGLRWFTPAAEVDLCGHATLAAAHALWETGVADATKPLAFQTLSGPLVCEKRDKEIAMDFPALDITPRDLDSEITTSLGITSALYVGKTAFDVLVELADEAAVRNVMPDFAALRRIETRGVIVTAPGDSPGIDFVSRFFAPRFGIDEDPVTGSAHCALGPYWAARLGKPEVVGCQRSRRGGIVRVAVNGERVTLSGQAVTVLRGELVADT